MRADFLLVRCDLIEASQPSVEYCRRTGIDFSSTAAACGGVYLVQARQMGRFFRPDDSGELMAWVDVLAEDAETPIDTIAWALDAPETVLVLTGAAPAIGLNAAVNPASYALDRVLRLHRLPLDWLRSGCDGACIIDRAAGGRWLLDLPPGRWAAEDTAHASELLASMQRLIDRSRFVVPSRKLEAA